MHNLCLFTVAALSLAGAALADPCEGPLPRRGDVFSGPVRYVGDGDSLCVGPSSDPRTWIEIRVADFYAPELHEPDGPAAKATLERLTEGRSLRCVAGKRSYDRVVATCTLGGVALGERLRRAGGREGGRGR
jgi:micrococcal nuclease